MSNQEYEYVPHDCLLMFLSIQQASKLTSLSTVLAVFPVQSQWKPSSLDSSLNIHVVSFAKGSTSVRFTKTIMSSLPGDHEAIGHSQDSRLLFVRSSNPTELLVLLHLPHVISISSVFPKNLLNDAGNKIVSVGNASSNANPYSLYLSGQGQKVAIADSGMDYTSCYFVGSDIASVEVHRNMFVVNSNLSRVPGYWSFMDAHWENGDHGSHVGGTIAGKFLIPSAVDNFALHRQNGIASNTQLLVTDIGCDTVDGCACGLDSTGQLIPCECDASKGSKCEMGALGLPFDWNKHLFPFSHDNGFNIMSNSWGDAENQYTGDSSQAIDAYVSANRNFLVLFAAGNAGQMRSISSQANSKNSVVVGASRTGKQDFLYLYSSVIDWVAESKTWGEAFAVQVLGCSPQSTKQECVYFLSNNFDGCSTTSYCGGDPTSCGCSYDDGKSIWDLGELACKKCVITRLEKSDERLYSVENLAAFSSKGPAADGRIKPEVIAPGDAIASSRAYEEALNGNTCGHGYRAILTDTNLGSHLDVKSGTSMATPLTAGYAALLKEYLSEYYPNRVGAPNSGTDGIPNPSAALLRALLVQSAEPMMGLYTLVDTEDPKKFIFMPLDNPYAQGFGRILLENIIPLNGDVGLTTRVLSDETMSLSTGEVKTFQFVVDPSDPVIAGKSQTQIRVTLTWTDPPATAGSKIALVNDLDLEVKYGAETRLGNDAFNIETIKNYNEHDRLNNVERVIIMDPTLYTGTYSISVTGYSVPQGPQSFALVVSYGKSGYQQPLFSWNGMSRGGNSDSVFSGTGGSSKDGPSSRTLALIVVSVCVVVIASVLAGVYIYRRRNLLGRAGGLGHVPLNADEDVEYHPMLTTTQYAVGPSTAQELRSVQ
eukprot:ANDGO_07846.mRNA.1 Serine protease/ABC transporter B family protein tagD